MVNFLPQINNSVTNSVFCYESYQQSYDDEYADGEIEFKAKRPHMSKNYHLTGQNQLK